MNVYEELLKVARSAPERVEVFEMAATAAIAGEPRPDGPQLAQRGWDFGNNKRRVLGGEILGFVCQGTKCFACGWQDWGARAGCRCNDDVQTQTIRWGVLVDDPAGPHARFMTYDEVRASGLPLIDLYSNTVVELPEPESHPRDPSTGGV